MWLTAHPGLSFPFKKLHPFCVLTCSFCLGGGGVGVGGVPPEVSTAVLSIMLPTVCLVQNTEGSIHFSRLVQPKPPSQFHGRYGMRSGHFRQLHAPGDKDQMSQSPPACQMQAEAARKKLPKHHSQNLHTHLPSTGRVWDVED